MAEPVPSVPGLQSVKAPPQRTRKTAAPATRNAILLAAAFGGISPNLLRMAVSLTGDKGELPQNASYWIGLLLFAFLGGAMSLIWSETEIRRAYYLGLPSLLQVGVSSVTEKGPKKDPDQQERPAEPAGPSGSGAGFWLLTPPAYAQEQNAPNGDARERPRPQRQPSAVERQEIILQAPTQQAQELALDYGKNRRLSLQLDSIPGGTELLLYGDGNLKSRVILKKTDEDTTLELPLLDSITAFRVQKGNAWSEMVPVAPLPGSKSVFRIDVDRDPWSGFLQALGARNVSPYDVEVERVRTPP
jgi:hypothetical protein